MLFGQGIRGVEPKLRLSRIDFAALTTSEGHPIPDRLRRELEREYVRLNLVEQQLRTVEKERDTADRQDPAVDRKRQMLCALRGIGQASAAILAREVFVRSFASRRQLGSCWGRRVLIEIAWLWQKYQSGSSLSRWYEARAAGQSPRIRRIMLVALARKLAVALWRYVKTGLIPDGAVMSDAIVPRAAA